MTGVYQKLEAIPIVGNDALLTYFIILVKRITFKGKPHALDDFVIWYSVVIGCNGGSLPTDDA